MQGLKRCFQGSPRNCKAQQIKVKKYSPGGLVRVTNGMRVSRSNQQDSCPKGWKIWSPRNKADWTAVYNAMGKNMDNYPGKPHVIIDITRNQNGCGGGCTKYAMKSTVGQQSTWKTTDGSAWWLRDTKFSQPDGNYKANCYLKVKKVDPNDVRFDDTNCNNHSNEYLCQPVRKFPGVLCVCVCVCVCFYVLCVCVCV